MDDTNGGMNFSMPVTPSAGAYPYPVYQSGNSGFGGDGAWLLLLVILLAGNGGWGMGGFGGFGGGLGIDFPWILNGQNGINTHISDGFRDAQISDQITSVRDGIGSLSTQLCDCCGSMQMSLANGFAGTTAAITGAQNALAQQLYSNEIASLNRSFAEQTANTAGFTATNTGIADLKYTIASEACADRAAVQQGIQTVLDKLCALELDSAKREAADLRTQLNMAQLAASQTAQNAFISQGFANEVDALYNRLNSCPVPTTPVYGRTPIFTCNSGCGCGNNVGGFNGTF